jgi:hypothetical protein
MRMKYRNSGLSFVCAAVGAAATLTLISCASTTRYPASTGASSSPPVVSAEPATEPLGGHWVHNQRLRAVMAELSKRNPDWPASVPQEPEDAKAGKPKAFEDVAAHATALMVAADRLPDIASKLKMNEADRRGFLAEAQVLHDQAERLRTASGQGRIERMQIDMESINSTCISCHSRYRDFSGQLDRTQASLSPAESLKTR